MERQESVFATEADFEAELKALPAVLAALSQYQGRLAEGPATVLAAFQAVETALQRVIKLYVYAGVGFAVETTDPAAARRNGQAQSLIAQLMAAIAFIDPDLIAIGEPTLKSWLAQEPGLAIYTHYIDNLFRKQAHVRSAEVEELLGLASDTFGNVFNTQNMLTNADFKFAPAVGLVRQRSADHRQHLR